MCSKKGNSIKDNLATKEHSGLLNLILDTQQYIELRLFP